MINIFADGGILDKLTSNEIKRFTQEEKNIIDKFIYAILKLDNKSDLKESRAEIFNNRLDRITEVVTKKIFFKKVYFELSFSKYFSNKVKDNHLFPILLDYDGHYNTDFSYRDKMLKEFAKEGSITGILVKGIVVGKFVENLNFMLKSKYDETFKPMQSDYLGIRTRFRNGKLTAECKYKMKNYHLDIIWKAISKITKIKKKLIYNYD